MKINKNILIATTIFLVTIITHGYNLLSYPMFLGDEGTYTSQGWWLVDKLELTPYTYWYDHYFFGWLMIGIWLKLTGGLFTFGYSIYSTRIFITLLTAITNVLIYLIVRKVTKKPKYGLIASALFTFSPLAIYYHRMVLLDNIMVFWLMLSIYFAVYSSKNLVKIFTSAICIGLAFLSKETAIFFLPGLFAIVISYLNGNSRKYGLFIWAATVIFLIFQLPLLALIKGEFFPSGMFGGTDHVSLVETYAYQSTRGIETGILDPTSSFRYSLRSWITKDNLSLQIGFASFLFVTIVGIIRKKWLSLSLAGVYFGYLLFLIRGGLILDFYVIPLIATTSLIIPIALMMMAGFVRKYRFNNALYTVVLIMLIARLIFISDKIYTNNATQAQLDSIEYIRNNISSEKVILVNNWAFTDLKLAPTGVVNFPNTEWFYKVELDPEIKDTKFNNNWKNIDYILVDNEMESFLSNNNEHSLLDEAYLNSERTFEYKGLKLNKVNK